MIEIGTKIKKLRELRSYTQEFMAQKLNVSQSSYSRFENDEGDLTVAQLHKIADVLEVKIDDLINFNEKLVLNNYASNQANQAYIINHVVSEKERELYEKNIKLLEDKIAYLQEQLKGK